MYAKKKKNYLMKYIILSVDHSWSFRLTKKYNIPRESSMLVINKIVEI